MPAAQDPVSEVGFQRDRRELHGAHIVLVDCAKGITAEKLSKEMLKQRLDNIVGM